MICPAAPPSASNVKLSGAATWLDRLRSSRDAKQTSPSTSVHTPTLPTLHSVHEEEHGDGTAEDILCELFAMGGGGGGETPNRARNRRKQQNPRFWDATASSNKSSNAACPHDFNTPNNKLASSGDNSLNQHRKDPAKLEQEVDLKGYSRSEVTVIDSSIQGWKVELFVFRKNKSKGLWKVRQKTTNSKNLVNARRKRKLVKPNSSENDDDYDDEGRRDKKKKKKKMIVGASDSASRNLYKNGNGKEVAVVPFINERQVRDEKVTQTLNGLGCLHGEASVKSSHWKSRSEASSVILVKPLLSFDEPGNRKPGKISGNKDHSVL